jgi:hypothetical protein
MFRIVCDPSSGSIELYLTEIIRGGSQMFVVCMVGVWQRNFETVVSDHTHDKHVWTTTNNLSQVQLYIPWWWIAYDPKHVGVIFNFVSFELLYNVDFNL